MTTIETPPPASPEPAQPERRSGFYLAPWVLAVVGGLVLLGIGFAVGRLVDGEHGEHSDGPFFRGGEGGGDHRGLRIVVVLVVLSCRSSPASCCSCATTRRPDRTRQPSTRRRTPSRCSPIASLGEIDEAEFVSRRNALRS